MLIGDAGVLGRPIRRHIHFQPVLNSLNTARGLYGVTGLVLGQTRKLGLYWLVSLRERPSVGHAGCRTPSRTAYSRAASVRTATSNIRQIPACVLQQGVDLDPGEGFGLGSHSPAHGFTISIPMSSKSRTLRVASLMRLAAAMAAIWQSAEATGRPAERRAAAMKP